MKLSKKLLACLISLIMAATMVLPATAAQSDVPGSPNQLANRVVGYLPSYRTSCIDIIDYSALTHVILSFITYNNGSITFPFSASDIQRIRTHCDENGVKLMLALGGWGGFTYSNCPTDTAAERTTLVNQIMDIVNQYDLDGVDIDTEVTDSVYWSGFDAFASELSGRLKPDGKLLTMAVSTWFTDPIASSTYDYFDFINLMTYDYSNSDVAPMSQVTNMLSAYSSKGVSNDRMTIGVPFYGYDGSHNAYTYDEIIRMSTAANETDVYNGISYNGENTIRTKTEMSKSYGGIMIWELGQDSFGEYSLLDDIKDVMTEGGAISASVAPVTNLTATAPSTTTVNLSWTASPDASTYNVYQGSTLLGSTSATSYSALGLTARTDYTFSVAAVNAAGDASKKVNVSVTTPAGSAGDYEEWDSARSYPQDSYVIYQNKIYRTKWWADAGVVPGASEWNGWEYIGDVASSVEETIAISTDSIKLTVGETTTISASTTPSGTAYSWSTSNAPVATINNGTITAVSAGTAVITATSAGGKTASCTVTVEAAPVVEPTTPIYSLFKVGSKACYNSLFGLAQAACETIYVDNRAYVSMREGALALGGDAVYTEENGVEKITVTFPEYSLIFYIGSTNVHVVNPIDDALSFDLTLAPDQVAIYSNGRCYLPARALGQVGGEPRGYSVTYVSNDESGVGDYVLYANCIPTTAEAITMVQTGAQYF